MKHGTAWHRPETYQYVYKTQVLRASGNRNNSNDDDKYNKGSDQTVKHVGIPGFLLRAFHGSSQSLCNSVRLDIIIITLSFQMGNWSGLGVRLWGQDRDPGHLVAPCAHSHHLAPQKLLISGDYSPPLLALPLTPQRRWELEAAIPGMSHMLIFCLSYFSNWGKDSGSLDIKYLDNCLSTSFSFYMFRPNL